MEYLESRVRRLERIIVILLLLVVTVGLVGWRSSQGKTVEAKNFVLVDSKGKSRAIFSMAGDGLPFLSLDGDIGKESLFLTPSSITFYDAYGSKNFLALSSGTRFEMLGREKDALRFIFPPAK